MRANSESLRRRNRALVLAALRSLGPVAHTSISAWSGLSSATISAITGELVEEGALERTHKAAGSSRGRPRVLFRQKPDYAFLAIARITASVVEFSLIDYCGTLKDRFATRRDPGEDIATFSSQFKTGLERLVNRAGLRASDLNTISITSKGLVARDGPIHLWSPSFDDARIDFGQMLRPKFSGKITLTNETRFAAQAVANRALMGEIASPQTRFAALSLDHSIGLGIATIGEDGEIVSYAPPFGHMTHMPDGALCRCGSRGCIEAYAGFYGIIRTAFEAPENQIPAKFIPLAEIAKIADNARKGDRMARYAFRIAGEALGIGLSRLFSFMGTMPVTIAGPGLVFFDLMREGFDNHIENNMQVRFEQRPVIAFEEDEATLIYQGNMQASLADLDALVASERGVESSLS